jgi:four helix bundle protein
MMPFERLEAWQSSHLLTLEVYRATDAWPNRELYGLTAQARRAAVSICANIAEGAAKRGRKEFGRYLDMALGSFSELTYILLLSRDLGIMRPEEGQAVEALRGETGKLLWGLYRRVRPALGDTP